MAPYGGRISRLCVTRCRRSSLRVRVSSARIPASLSRSSCACDQEWLATTNPRSASSRAVPGAVRTRDPTTKKVAGTRRSERIRTSRVVSAGLGPSSKVRATRPREHGATRAAAGAGAGTAVAVTTSATTSAATSTSLVVHAAPKGPVVTRRW